MGKVSQGYTLVRTEGWFTRDSQGYSREHVVVAERALGKRLPRGAHVHHVNEDRADNRPCNPVVCPDNAYHKLIHYRTRALLEGGNANWRRCRYCYEWDDPAHMYVAENQPSMSYHRGCRNFYLRRTGAYRRWDQSAARKRRDAS